MRERKKGRKKKKILLFVLSHSLNKLDNFGLIMILNKWKIKINDKMLTLHILVLICLNTLINCENVIDEYDGNGGLYSIDGRVYAPEIYSSNDLNWQRDTVITINDGEYSGFLKADGTFSISGIPSGSYVVEVSNPDYYYESVSKLGKRKI